MSKILIVDGGSRELDLGQATIAHIHRPEYRHNRKWEEVLMFFDDVAKEERLVLEVSLASTLAGNKPKDSLCAIKLTTIYGYDPANRRWGPQERSSYLDITWENARRLVNQITGHAFEHFEQFNGGAHWYRKNRPHQ